MIRPLKNESSIWLIIVLTSESKGTKIQTFYGERFGDQVPILPPPVCTYAGLIKQALHMLRWCLCSGQTTPPETLGYI